MKKVNFNSLKNLETPQSLIEKAISIPDTHKKKIAPLIKYRKSLSFAACLVIVCAVCLFVHFSFNNGTNPVVKTESISVSDSEADKTANNDNKTNETENKKKNPLSFIKDLLEIGSFDDNTSSDIFENPSEKPSETESETSPTQGETENKTEENTQPTEGETPPTQTPTQPDYTPPSEPETVAPNEPNESKPNEPGINELPPSDPSSPGVAPENPYPNAKKVPFRIEVNSYYLTSSEKVMCVLVNENEYALSDIEVATVYEYQGVTYAQLLFSINTSGYYKCYFFTDNGYDLGCCSQYVDL